MGIIDRALADLDWLRGHTHVDSLSVAEQLGLPTFDDLPSSAPVGAVAYATGDGSAGEGVYHYDGSGWVQGNGSGGGGSTAPSITSQQLTATASEAAAYYHDPQSEYVPGQDKTIILWRGIDADPHAAVYDNAAGTFESRAWVAPNPLSNTDEHGPPGMAVDSNGYIHSFFGSHGGQEVSGWQYVRSTNAYDANEWDASVNLTGIPDGTYPSMDADSNGNVYAMYRTGQHNSGGAYPQHAYATIVESTDGGSTWSDLGPIIDTTGHPDSDSDAYISDMDVQNGVLHFTWTVAHGTSHNDTRDDLYHAYYDPADSTCYAYDGTSLGSTIVWGDHSACRVYSGGAASGYHAYDGSTSTWYYLVPAIPSGGGREYILVTYDGSSLSELNTGATLAAGGSVNGLRINSNGNPEAHIITGDGSNTGDYGGSYERYVYDGSSWSSTTVVSESTEDIYRLDVPRNASDDLAAFYSPAGSDTNWNLPLSVAGALSGFSDPGPTNLETFEDGDAAEYTVTNSTGSHSVQQSTVLQGSNTLEITGSNYALETSDLPDITMGENLSWTLRYPSSATSAQQYNVYLLSSGSFPSTDDGYRFIVSDDPNQDLKLKIERRDAGSPTTLATTTVTGGLPAEDLTVELVTAADGAMSFRLKDGNGDLYAWVTAEDANYSTFSIVGWNLYQADGTSRTGYFDWLRSLAW